MMKRRLNILSKYTVELRYLMENGFNFGLQKYPIFNEEYRPILNQKILNHYRFREIGFETAELFKVYLNTKMDEIMPYYNQLYKSELIEFNPLENVKQNEVFKSDFNGVQNNISVSDGTSDTTTCNDSLDISSDTPQGFLVAENINNSTWATNADKFHGNSEDNNKTHLSGNSDTTTENYQNYEKVITGKTPGENFSEMLLKYRETFLNIDMLIINELSDLFMNIY